MEQICKQESHPWCQPYPTFMLLSPSLPWLPSNHVDVLLWESKCQLNPPRSPLEHASIGRDQTRLINFPAASHLVHAVFITGHSFRRVFASDSFFTSDAYFWMADHRNKGNEHRTEPLYIANIGVCFTVACDPRSSGHGRCGSYYVHGCFQMTHCYASSVYQESSHHLSY